MKLQNNIVSDSEMEITFDSFNPTAGRLADCLLGFSIQVQLTLVLALSRHTQGHTATATTRRTSAPGLRPAPVTHRPPQQGPGAQAADKAAGRRARPRPREHRAGGDAWVAGTAATIARAELARSWRRQKRKRQAAGLHSFLFSCIFGPQFASFLVKI